MTSTSSEQLHTILFQSFAVEINKEALFMHISITVRDQILLIVSPCAAHVRMTADVICHICSNLIEVDSRKELTKQHQKSFFIRTGADWNCLGSTN